LTSKATIDSGDDLLVLDGLVIETDGESSAADISLRVKRGEVHAFFGDNPELLSHIIRVVAGFEPIDRGAIVFDGVVRNRMTPRKAMRLGIEVIDRSRKCFDNLNVLDNIFAERSRFIPGIQERIGKRAWKEKAEKFFQTLQMRIPLNSKLFNLTEAEQKVVEIARSICADPKLLLIEEAVLNGIQENLRPGTIDRLLYLLTLLVKGGTTVVFTCVDMERIFSFADTVTIIKCDEVQKTAPVREMDKFQLVQMAYDFMTSRKELEKSNFELFYYRQLYQQILDKLLFPVLVTDLDRKILIHNQRARELLFPEKSDVLLMPVEEILGVPSSRLEELEKELLDFPASRIGSIEDLYPEMKLVISPIRDSYGSNMGLLFLFGRIGDADLTEQDLLSQVKDRDAEYRMNEIVHEVKNPLGIIINFLRLIRDEPSLETVRSLSRNIEDEVGRITRLLGKLKNKSEPADRSAPLPAVLSDLISDIATFLKPLMKERGIIFETDGLLPVALSQDADQIRQVMLNIMLNAVEAMDSGGILRIETQTERLEHSNWLRIVVSDTGTGIESADLSRIFVPFYTTKEGNSRGIGLSICREIVESFKGRISVSTQSGKGTAFTILLPLSDTAASV